MPFNPSLNPRWEPIAVQFNPTLKTPLIHRDPRPFPVKEKRLEVGKHVLEDWKLGLEASNSPWELESVVKLKRKSGICLYRNFLQRFEAVRRPQEALLDV